MSIKVLCYGVQSVEEKIFNDINKDFGFQLTFTNDLLNDDNAKQVKGFDAIILFVNCQANAKNLQLFKDRGVKYIVTRTVGYNHIDLVAAKQLGYIVGRVPGYSPLAIASLALTYGLSLLRKTAHMNYQTAHGNFKIDNDMFAKELKNCTVGVIGTGRIGYETANLWKNIGTTVIGYDPFKSELAQKILTYHSFDEVVAKSDVISLHMPYFPGQNDKLINDKVIAKMKKGAIIINTARAELVDTSAVIAAIKVNKLWGYAADVFNDEQLLINNQFKKEQLAKFPIAADLVNLYPRVLISPHVAYFTDEAVKNMAEVSFKNLDQLIKTNTCDNMVS